MLTLVLCQFTYDWVVFVIVRDVPAYFRQFLNVDIQIVRVYFTLTDIAASRYLQRVSPVLSLQSVCLCVCRFVFCSSASLHVCMDLVISAG